MWLGFLAVGLGGQEDATGNGHGESRGVHVEVNPSTPVAEMSAYQLKLPLREKYPG